MDTPSATNYDVVDEDQFIEDVKARDWFNTVTRDIPFFVIDAIFRGQCADKYGTALHRDIGSLDDSTANMRVFSTRSSGKRTLETIHELMKAEGYGLFLKYSEECQAAAQKLHQFCNEKNSWSNPETALRYRELYSSLTPYLLLVVFNEKFLTERIWELIEEKTGERKQEAFDNLTYVKKFSGHTEELLGILDLAIRAQAGEDVSEEAEVHAQKYGWIATRWKFEAPWNTKDIMSRIQQYDNPQAEKESIINAREKANAWTEKFIEEHQLTTEEQELILVTKELVFLRTFRTENMNKSHALIRDELEEYAKTQGFTLSEVIELSCSEIAVGKNLKELVEKRKKDYYVVLMNNEIKVVYDELKNKLDELGVFAVSFSEEEVKGQIAFKGKAKGKVRIVRGAEDIDRVEAGDILVATMTFPNYVPAMERAAAFVTDEGGILCHAAIIAREMSKPCITGTKNATLLLKDGDLVEVDAEKGIVRKI